jgi:hypothetical protein
MDSIRIDSGIKRISINEDPERVISFNPSDVTFAERFYKLIGEFEAKQAEYEQRAEALDASPNELDGHGLPANAGEKIAFMREVCEFMHGKIDYLFGNGTSQKVFEGVLSLEPIGQFFDGIVPFIQKSRSEKVAKYAPGNLPKSKRVMK